MDQAEFELVATLVAYSRLNSKDRSWLARSPSDGTSAERLPRLEELIELRAFQVETAELARLGIMA